MHKNTQPKLPSVSPDILLKYIIVKPLSKKDISAIIGNHKVGHSITNAL